MIGKSTHLEQTYHITVYFILRKDLITVFSKKPDPTASSIIYEVTLGNQVPTNDNQPKSLFFIKREQAEKLVQLFKDFGLTDIKIEIVEHLLILDDSYIYMHENHDRLKDIAEGTMKGKK